MEEGDYKNDLSSFGLLSMRSNLETLNDLRKLMFYIQT